MVAHTPCATLHISAAVVNEYVRQVSNRYSNELLRNRVLNSDAVAMVITFPKQSAAMVTLFHGEGNFPLLFWYTLTKPPELHEISVNLLNVVFYSVKQNINESIWRWEYCYCSLQCSYSVTCWSFYVNWASADKIWTDILHIDSYVAIFVVCQISWEVLKVVPWTFNIKQLWNSNRFGSCVDD